MPIEIPATRQVYTAEEVDTRLAGIQGSIDEHGGRIGALENASGGYTGQVVLTPSDPWEEVITLHDGNGSITLADGQYIASAPITPTARKLAIQSATMGGATIQARWDLVPGTGLLLYNLDLRPPPSDRLMFADLSWVEMRDCNVLASAANIDVLMLYNHGELRITSRDRVSTWEIGPGVTADVLDLDSGAALKVVGNVTDNDVRFNLHSGFGADARLFTLDNASAVFAGFRVYSYSTGPAGRGIEARRNSRLTIQDTGNRLQGLRFGIMARQCSTGHIDGITITECDAGVWQRDGGQIVMGTGVVFGTNQTNVST